MEGLWCKENFQFYSLPLGQEVAGIYSSVPAQKSYQLQPEKKVWWTGFITFPLNLNSPNNFTCSSEQNSLAWYKNPLAPGYGTLHVLSLHTEDGARNRTWDSGLVSRFLIVDSCQSHFLISLCWTCQHTHGLNFWQILSLLVASDIASREESKLKKTLKMCMMETCIRINFRMEESCHSHSTCHLNLTLMVLLYLNLLNLGRGLFFCQLMNFHHSWGTCTA